MNPKSKSTRLLQPGDCIVFDGDSLTSRRLRPNLDTWPYLRLMNWDGSYADHVADWLFCNRPDLRLSFRQAAIGGSIASECLARYDEAVKPHKPAWVVMTISTNDHNRHVPLKEFEAALTKYARRLKQDSGGRMMILAGFKPFPFLDADKLEFRERAKYYQVIRKVLRQQDGLYVDVGTPLFQKARQLHKLWPGHTLYSDGCHLNAVGNAILTTQVLQALGVLTLTEG